MKTFAKKIIFIMAVSGLATFHSGCASSIAIGSRIANGNPKGEIYPATRMDTATMGGLWEAGSWAILLEPFPIIDIPFSFVTDTLVLPYDIYCAKKLSDKNNTPHE